MPAPPPQRCSKPGCDWVTPDGCPTWDLISNFMTNHTNSNHAIAAPPTTTPNQPQPKLQTLPRPEFTLGMSEAAWDFVKSKWDAYIGQATTTVDQKAVFPSTSAFRGNMRMRSFFNKQLRITSAKALTTPRSHRNH